MTKLSGTLFLYLCLALCGASQAADAVVPPLPDWQVLEFEEKAYWATATSRLEILPVEDDPKLWELNVLNSVVDNSEQITERFDAVTGRAVARSRVSRGKGQRLKSYQYEADGIVRERRNPPANPGTPPEEWPVSSSTRMPYPVLPDPSEKLVVTSPYVLVLLAQRLQAQGVKTPGEGKSIDVLVHTDINFYRVRLTSGNGIPIDVDYQVNGGEAVRGTRETLAVALQVTPVHTPEPENDFSLFGLQGEIILFFDRNTSLPLQVRGMAPRIGATAINLKSATLRTPHP
jgi:hypothetical protein